MKLYAHRKVFLHKRPFITNEFSQDIKIQLEMEKCESVHIDKEELRKKDLLRVMINNCALIQVKILQICRN